MTPTEAIEQLLGGAPLSREQARDVMDQVMAGEATSTQIAGLLIALRAKGETAEEMTGFVDSMRAHATPLELPEGAIDTCGTGGDRAGTFNISTAAALVASGAGIPVAKHGNRAASSRCGSADVLEALGVRLELSPEQEARVLERTGIVFMFAPLHHPAMKHVGPIRRELGMPTIMNVLGPVTNPAGARRQVVGVSDPALLELIAGALAELGHDRALVVHGQPGLDELSPLGTTEVLEVADFQWTRRTFDPAAELGWRFSSAEGLEGGDREDNAAKVEGVLRGDVGGPARAAVVLNAGAALYCAGVAPSLLDGVHAAEKALDEGRGWMKLEELRDATG